MNNINLEKYLGILIPKPEHRKKIYATMALVMVALTAAQVFLNAIGAEPIPVLQGITAVVLFLTAPVMALSFMNTNPTETSDEDDDWEFIPPKSIMSFKDDVADSKEGNIPAIEGDDNGE